MAQTLEEVAQNIFGLVDPILGKSDYRMGYERGLIKGAEWQQEQAKEMHKEDCISFAEEWEIRCNERNMDSKEQLYHEIYNK